MAKLDLKSDEKKPGAI